MGNDSGFVGFDEGYRKECLPFLRMEGFIPQRDLSGSTAMAANTFCGASPAPSALEDGPFAQGWPSHRKVRAQREAQAKTSEYTIRGHESDQSRLPSYAS